MLPIKGMAGVQAICWFCLEVEGKQKAVPHIINFKYPILFYFQNEMVWNSVMSNRNMEPRSNYIFKGTKWEQIKGLAQVSTQTGRSEHHLQSPSTCLLVMSVNYLPQTSCYITEDSFLGCKKLGFSGGPKTYQIQCHQYWVPLMCHHCAWVRGQQNK